MFGRLFIYIYQIFGHVLGETYQTYKHWTFYTEALSNNKNMFQQTILAQNGAGQGANLAPYENS